MRRYPIEVVKKKMRRRDPAEGAVITRRAYLEMLALARRTWAWDEIEERIELSCDACGSFVVNFLDLATVVYDLIEFLPDFDLKTRFLDRVEVALDSLDNCFRDASVNFYPDPDDLDDEEVAVIFDTSCSCYEYLVGEIATKKSEENHPEETHFYHPAPGVSVKMCIGPRLKW